MSKLTASVMKPGNGKPSNEVKSIMTIVKAGDFIVEPAKEDPKPEPNQEAKVEPVSELKKELTLMEKILKVENLQLIVEKRTKLVQTRSELERFQISSNDFNCSMRLNDSDGNVFTTSFTPGIKKVIDFLKSAFDSSIEDVEAKIDF